MSYTNSECPICREPRKQCEQPSCSNVFNSANLYFCDRCNFCDQTPIPRCCYMVNGALVCNSSTRRNFSTCEQHRGYEKQAQVWIQNQNHARKQVTCVFDTGQPHSPTNRLERFDSFSPDPYRNESNFSRTDCPPASTIAFAPGHQRQPSVHIDNQLNVPSSRSAGPELASISETLGPGRPPASPNLPPVSPLPPAGRGLGNRFIVTEL